MVRWIPFSLLILAQPVLGCATQQPVPAESGSTGGAETTDSSDRSSTGGEDTSSDDSSSTGGSTTSADESTSTGVDQRCVDLELALRDVADAYQTRAGILGLSVSAQSPGCDPWIQAAGVAQLPETALTSEYVLRTGSITKTFTAALLLRLVDQGRMTLEDTLQDWGIDLPAAEQITIRQLLNQTSGLSDYSTSDEFTAALIADPDRIWEPQELLDYAAALPSVGVPGAAHHYANTNYVIAGLVAQAADRRDYAASLRANVLEPAGLEHTYVEGDEDWTEPTAAGYLVPSGGRPLATVDRYHASQSWSAGAVVATASDVRLFMSTLLTTDFLSPESQAAMVELVDDYGLGVFRIESGDVVGFGHNGAVMGFQAGSLYDPSTGTTVAVLQNQININAQGGLESDHPVVLALALLQAASDADQR